MSTQRKHDSHHGFSASSNSFQPDQIISLESSSAGLSCCDPVCALVVDVAFLHIGKVALRRWTIIVCVTLTTHLGMEHGYVSVLQTEICGVFHTRFSCIVELKSQSEPAMSINLARASFLVKWFILEGSASCLRGSLSVAGLLIELNRVSFWLGSRLVCGSNCCWN